MTLCDETMEGRHTLGVNVNGLRCELRDQIIATTMHVSEQYAYHNFPAVLLHPSQLSSSLAPFIQISIQSCSIHHNRHPVLLSPFESGHGVCPHRSVALCVQECLNTAKSQFRILCIQTSSVNHILKHTLRDFIARFPLISALFTHLGSQVHQLLRSRLSTIASHLTPPM